jgi:c(7)-type cytochrome triheme protein
MLGLTALLAQDKTPPAKFVVKAKTGNITFDHAAHAKREKNACKVCHPSLFKQDTKAPLAFKPPHKNHEDKKTSCGSCHRADGTAFETKANCTNGKCHVRAAAK